MKFSVLQAAQRPRAAAPARRHRLRGVGAWRPAREDRDARGHRIRSGQRRAVRAQRVQHRIPRAGRLLRCRRRLAQRHRRPQRVPRPQRQHARTGGDGPQRTCPAGSAPGSIPAARSRWPFARRRARRARWCSGSGHGATPAEASDAGAALPRLRLGRRRAGRGARALAPDPGHGAGAHAGAGAERAGQRLADVPDDRLPLLGAQRLLPVRRRVRFPRPAAGLHGDDACRARTGARQQLLLCAAHQFVEGDVQHWWHPPQTAACAPHCSDDYLWLPLATSRYVLATADTGVLDERVGYVEGRPLHARRGVLLRPAAARSEQHDTLYEHCVRAIEHSRAARRARPAADRQRRLERRHEPRRREGAGREHLAGLLLLRGAAALCRGRHAASTTSAFARRCDEEAGQAAQALEQHGWDGAWYRRAYFDDGTPLGSAGNDECRIDSIAQSWSVLSGAAPARAPRAGDGLARPASGAPRCRPDPAARAAVRQVAARPRLHQGLRARRARKRRPVHARGGLGGDGLRRARRRCARLGTAGHDQPGQPRQRRRRADRGLQGRAVRGQRRRLRAWRRTSAAAAGAGTPARPAGCTG